MENFENLKMMNLKKTTLFLFASMIVLLTACPKPDDGGEETPKETATKNLIKGAWKVNMDGTSTTIGASTEYSDIILTFNENNQYVMTGAEDVNAANRPAPNANGTWALNEDGTQITFDGIKTIDITLSETNLIFDFQGKEAPKFTADVTIEYNMIH